MNKRVVRVAACWLLQEHGNARWMSGSYALLRACKVCLHSPPALNGSSSAWECWLVSSMLFHTCARHQAKCETHQGGFVGCRSLDRQRHSWSRSVSARIKLPQPSRSCLFERRCAVPCTRVRRLEASNPRGWSLAGALADGSSDGVLTPYRRLDQPDRFPTPP